MRTTVFMVLGMLCGCAAQAAPIPTAGESPFLQAAPGTGSVSIKRNSADKVAACSQCRGVSVPKAQAQITAGGFSGYKVGMANGAIAITPTAF